MTSVAATTPESEWTGTKPTGRDSDFGPLLRQVQSVGLLNRRRGNYTARIGVTVGAFAATWWAFVALGNSWYQLIIAVVLGLISTQIAFLGHDAGHQQIARTRRVNDVVGLLAGDLLVGLSYGWWVDEHSRHHAHPNFEGLDPDIGDSVITFTPTQAQARTGSVERFIAAHQAWLFFPLLTLEGINLHVQSIGWLRRETSGRYRRTEFLLLAAHLITFVGLTLLVLSPGKALIFLAIEQAVWGVDMGCSFAPNHKGMRTVAPGQSLDYVRRQVLTTRNVRGGILTDVLLGGLNYQIEHHLFPNMPRANLRRVQPIVRTYCGRLELAYTEKSLVGSYGAALAHLNFVGISLRGSTNK